jgi:hypothetical protein
MPKDMEKLLKLHAKLTRSKKDLLVPQHILFDNGRVRSTNMEIYFESKSDLTGTLTVDGKKLLKLADQKLAIKENKLQAGKFSIPDTGMKDDFPAFPEINPDFSEIDLQKLQEVYTRLLPYTDNTPLRTSLQGVRFDGDQAVATNSSMLAWQNFKTPFAGTIPSSIAKYFVELDGPAKVAHTGEWFVLAGLPVRGLSGGWKFMARVPYNSFPDWRKVIGKLDKTFTVTMMNSARLEREIKVFGDLSEFLPKWANFRENQGRLVLSYPDENLTLDWIDCPIPFDSKFDLIYFHTILKTFSRQVIEIDLTKAGELLVTGQAEADRPDLSACGAQADKLKVLLMPVTEKK